MTVACVVVSDRGELYLLGCLKELRAQGWDPHVIDDSNHELGMAGAVRAAWTWALEQDCQYLLHVEEDFRFLAPIPIGGMKWILEENCDLAQIVLKRGPWSPEERWAGGIMELHPDDYDEWTSRSPRQVSFCVHSRIFSLNPCLIPRRILELGWPDGNEAEFTQRCLGEGYRFAFYGKKADPPLVDHIGSIRGQGWRL